MTRLQCACGEVGLKVAGPPIVSVECCCNSCRAGRARIEALPGSPTVLGEHGTTRYELYRKDRVRFASGAELLREFRLTPASHTRRVVASCCHTPVFTEFENGHWLSLYGGLWPAGTLPALQMRSMATDLPDPSILSNDVPNARTQSFTFVARLLGAWIAMGFRVPKVEVAGRLGG